ncbi:hypothetical protein SEA_CELAENA_60 [Microbacterium phage Celaena]|uniref:hypothetical protein n=1 Tax=Microbacterium phage Celaena TaxID=2591214 RepID=UPI001162B2A9|nr:hypothetical protein QDW17_gp60 [Microbacterium phage Celaena]YP_010752387.1 hypothetical protein QDW18_gp61 [Microbacterium phage Katzastrophic]QDH92439.1 hypothetical protein SEA_CELAENA_60 [Microbacterium phage Celaena]UKH48498.1 hypothetical protein SEA_KATZASTROPHIC_61 [Microbacterium phage Katzastrophic]WNO28774.1 hypothetical protein SEA_FLAMETHROWER_59 [Microbacterium phage FlameThrower]
MAASATKPGYTVSLFVSKTTPAREEKDGYNTRSFPAETIELARVSYEGGELEALLEKTKKTVDLIEEV